MMRKKFIVFGIIIFLGILGLGVEFGEKQSKASQKPSPRAEILDSPYDIVLIDIPSGTLKTEADYENPAMVISLGSFYIGKYEVTQKQWEKVMGNNASEIKGENFPVTNINWHQALDFVKKLTKKTGHIYRLPTTFEWEYACRAGTTTDYYFGPDVSPLANYEWYKDNAGGKPHPVGLKKPNPWGLYDITGNVNEWTATYWDPEPFYRNHPDDGRIFKGIYRKVKGSSFLHGRDVHFFCAYEHAYGQDKPRNYLGFRVLREKKKVQDE